MRTFAAVSGLAVLALPMVLIGALLGSVAVLEEHRPGLTVDPAKVPPLAAELLPDITRILGERCPEMPPAWVVAHIHAESGWDPTAFSADANGGAAGLYQLNEANWISAGGRSWPSTPPPPGADVLQPLPHLELAIPWVCANLRVVTNHLAETGKPAVPLDALLVCHVAGCDRVLQSSSGIPAAGEAGCEQRCAAIVEQYIQNVHRYLAEFAAPTIPADVGDLAQPAAFNGTGGGCTEPDPTSRGCLTPATTHALEQTYAAFGPPGPSAPIRSAGCWDEHAWNPRSDHPRGRACDFFPGRAGEFPEGEELENGWRIATWLRTHSAALRVKYIIWQGRIWSPDSPDDGGWGRPYRGGGVYDPAEATGGHFDHLHVSFRQ